MEPYLLSIKYLLQNLHFLSFTRTHKYEYLDFPNTLEHFPNVFDLAVFLEHLFLSNTFLFPEGLMDIALILLKNSRAHYSFRSCIPSNNIAQYPTQGSTTQDSIFHSLADNSYVYFQLEGCTYVGYCSNCWIPVSHTQTDIMASLFLFVRTCYEPLRLHETRNPHIATRALSALCIIIFSHSSCHNALCVFVAMKIN